ncbi:ATP-binding cassette domain-containing protein [Rhodohalobacter sp.]|uniref:ATP-binding cassette domain-containing protein n=1 Tax=Rhodohalobacter sp. TaxID=1974210 RepID=UPI002ACDF977|nr:ATP-binding cassette domain-containing protein [Rhodohalobacter sp.]MDZ7755023.1 ATP-binding cassette domain-containing protein [Rhodohalobacter sp.]
MISAQNITKTYDQRVLDNVSMAIPAGQTVSLIGPSGCGKSTLLRIIMGLIPADSGTVEIAGEKMHSDNMLKLRRKMGYVIQTGGLFPHLTARENLTLVTNFLKLDPDAVEQRIEKLTSLTNIDPALLERKPEKLSGGQAQRVSLMRALMLDPPILLMDEPLGSIDPLVRHELQNDLRSIFRELKKTVLIVTHDLGEAAFLGDSISLMQSGRIVQEGTIREIIDNPASEFVEQFVNAQRSPLEDL